MSDMRELLELAALACGLVVICPEETTRGTCVALRCSGMWNNNPALQHEYSWRPQSDDGDSRRLQVALGIDLFFDSRRWCAQLNQEDAPWFEVEAETNDSAGICLAVLKVAAEIGRRMKEQSA